MRFLRAAALAAFFYTATADLLPRTYDTHDFFALHLDSSVSPEHVARALGARHEGQIGELDGHHRFSLPKEKSAETDALLEDLRQRRILRRRSLNNSAALARRNDGLDGVLWSQKLALKQRLQKRIPPPLKHRDHSARVERSAQADATALQKQKDIATTLGITDPIFQDQWHLYNPVQLGHDLNVTGVWLEGVTGEGVTTAIVDDGLDMYSDDLRPNYYAGGSWDYNEGTDEPRPRLFDDKHGTRCAGEVAAARNDVCGVGMAYGSKVAGIRILSKPISDADEAAAVNYGYQSNDIYSCSWGPPDDGQTMDAPGILIRKAMVNGIQQGRNGRGSIFVFAAGNGANSDDNCNFDGYTNSIYSITVGAIDREGNHPSYSESCSAQLVVAYSSGSGDAIHTTDVGTSKCSTTHGGTSAAGPLAAGAAALALSVRPDLTWRDMQYLLIETAVPVHEDEQGWQTTSIGKKFSHDWGYGKVDTYALVQKAKDWQLVKPQAWYHSPWLRVEHEIPQGEQGLVSSFAITEDIITKANIGRLEHITVTMNVNHTRRGDLSVELRSPDGIVSHLSTPRRLDDASVGYVDWTFMSVAHWGESGIGSWSVVVKDTKVNEFSGFFVDWRINLWGEARDGSNQPLHPLPDEHDDDHNIEDAVVATTTVDPFTHPTEPPSVPTDHIDRPVNAKPSSVEAAPTSTAAPTTTTAADNAATPTETVSDSFLPSFFPTFGASKRTQVWIYASLALIVIFCAALGAYFYVQRRKRLRNNPQDDYEFEMIEDEDDTQALAGGSGPKRRRGGELYNAFAGESDEELLSDDGDEGPYRDRAGSDDDFDEKPKGGPERA
ncbi:pheromone processing endoprotease Kex2 [Paecilomyces variotii No. 5]|uniref:Pheromone processing endoprotease Kex2 n=1 Tax=Byssochlamys spectabilis (strain No. 5 / NBRC 109023) TaxID=1356009 RepID=V5G6G1_BYSSN|nr:pheromone processing endoprotease Kex2 [Paecilomyces variotii No. 5]